MTKGKSNGSSIKSDYIFFTILLIAVAYGVYVVIEPFINPIIIGSLTATLFFPLHNKILKFCKNKRAVASIITCSSIFALVFIPILIFLSVAINEGKALVGSALDYAKEVEFEPAEETSADGTVADSAVLEEGAVEEVPTLLDHAPAPEKYSSSLLNKISKSKAYSRLKDTFDIDDENIEEMFDQFLSSSKKLLGQASDTVFNLISTAGSLIFNFLIMMLVMFYIFVDGERVAKYIGHLSPLPRSEEQRLIKRIKAVSKSAIQGTFLTACCQGLFGTIGLALIGVPAIFLGCLWGITSIIPVVGTAIVLVPVCIYLAANGLVGQAVFILVWALIFNNIVDYLIRPRLMRSEGDMPSTLLLFAIIGGVGKFGLLGFVYGPLIFGVMSVMLWIYEQRNSKFLSDQDNK